VIELPRDVALLTHPVLVLDLDAPPVIERRIHAEDGGVIRLPAHLAQLDAVGDDKVNVIGLAAPWRNAATEFAWVFPVEQPGDYSVALEANVPVHQGVETGPYGFVLTLDDSAEYAARVGRLYDLSERDGQANQDRRYSLGSVRVPRAGMHRLALRMSGSVPDGRVPVPFTGLRLVRT
jgi:hypothetical protein